MVKNLNASNTTQMYVCMYTHNNHSAIRYMVLYTCTQFQVTSDDEQQVGGYVVAKAVSFHMASSYQGQETQSCKVRNMHVYGFFLLLNSFDVGNEMYRSIQDTVQQNVYELFYLPSAFPF